MKAKIEKKEKKCEIATFQPKGLIRPPNVIKCLKKKDIPAKNPTSLSLQRFNEHNSHNEQIIKISQEGFGGFTPKTMN